MKKSLVLLAGAALALGVASCKKDTKGTTASGIDYEFFKGSARSALASEGDIYEFDYTLIIGDSTVQSSVDMNNNEAIKFGLLPMNPENPFELGIPLEALYLMNSGDSAIFKVPSKVYFEKTGAPSQPWIQETDSFKWVFNVRKITTVSDFVAANEKLRKVSNDFQTMEGGLQYKVVTLGEGGTKIAPNDELSMHVSYQVGDSVIFDSYAQNQGQPVPQMAMLPNKPGELTQGLFILQKGDSAVFQMDQQAYAAISGQPKQEWMKDTDMHVWKVKMVDVKSSKAIKAEMDKKQAEAKEAAKSQNANDVAAIEAFLKQTNVQDYKKTESGLFYVISKEGTGNNIAKGQDITVNYTGSLLNGKVFDSNVQEQFGHMEPLPLKVGVGQVIPGWDEGLQLLKKGSKATFYIPSDLAYGSRAMGDQIPANSILIFDVEILDVK